MGIPTERSMNRCIIPVVQKPYKREKFPVEISLNQEVNYDNLLGFGKRQAEKIFRIDNYWDQRSFMLMDVITTRICQKIFGNRIPRSTTDDRVTENRSSKDDIDQMLKNPESCKITITYNDIKKIPYFKPVTGDNIRYLIERMSKTRISLPFETRVFDFNQNCRRFYHKEIYLQNFDLLFNKVERIRNKEYRFSLDTPLSRLFLSNIAQLNVDFLDESIYQLKKFDHLFYRCIISGSKNKNSTKKIHLNEIRKRLNIGSNIYQAKDMVEKSLDRIYEKGLILNFDLESKKGIRMEEGTVVNIILNKKKTDDFPCPNF